MSKQKSREELFTQPYLSKIEIARMLDVPRPIATKIYFFAKKIDEDELKYFIYETKVRRTSVLTVCGLTQEQLIKKGKHQARQDRGAPE